MKYKLNVSDNTFAKVLRRGFGIEARDFNFIPEGEAGWLYRFTDQKSNQSFVMKTQKKPRKHGTAAYVALHKLGFTHMPQPVLSKKGKLWKRHWFNNYSVQEYIELGKGNDKFVLEDEYLPQLGRALRDLHDTHLSKEVIAKLPSEQYVPLYLKKVQKHIRQTKKGAFKQYPEVQSLLMNNMSIIERFLESAVKNGKELQKQQLPLVLVHGDVHPYNLLRSKNKELYIADWENAHMSHAEQDLMYFDDRQIQLISKGYGRDLLKNYLAIKYYRQHLHIRGLDFFAYNLGVKGKIVEDRHRGVKGLKETCELLAKEYGQN